MDRRSGKAGPGELREGLAGSPPPERRRRGGRRSLSSSRLFPAQVPRSPARFPGDLFPPRREGVCRDPRGNREPRVVPGTAAAAPSEPGQGPGPRPGPARFGSAQPDWPQPRGDGPAAGPGGVEVSRARGWGGECAGRAGSACATPTPPGRACRGGAGRGGIRRGRPPPPPPAPGPPPAGAHLLRSALPGDPWTHLSLGPCRAWPSRAGPGHGPAGSRGAALRAPVRAALRAGTRSRPRRRLWRAEVLRDVYSQQPSPQRHRLHLGGLQDPRGARNRELRAERVSSAGDLCTLQHQRPVPSTEVPHGRASTVPQQGASDTLHKDHHHQCPIDRQPRLPPTRLRHSEFHRGHRAGVVRPGHRLLHHQVHQVEGQHLPNTDLRAPRLQAGGGRCPRPPQVKRPPLVSPCPRPDCPPAQAPHTRLCKAGTRPPGPTPSLSPARGWGCSGVCTLWLLPGDAGGQGGPIQPRIPPWAPHPALARHPGDPWPWVAVGGPFAGPSPTPGRARAGTGGTETNKGFSCNSWCPCHCHPSPVTLEPQQWVLSWEILVAKKPLGIWLFLPTG